MNGWSWILIGWFIANAIAYIALAGSDFRPKYTGGAAVIAVIFYAVLIWVVFQAVAS